MKKRLRITLFAFLLIGVFFSCHNKREQINAHVVNTEVEEIIVDSKKGPFYRTDTMIDSAYFVKLETTEDCLIGSINQLLFKDSLMIIVDSNHANAVYVFDLQGHYKYSIGKRGLGPEEYINVNHVSLKPGGKEIAILDKAQRKILYFSLENEYKRSEKTPFIMTYFDYLKSGNIAVNAELFSTVEKAFGQYIDNTLIVTSDKFKILYGACKAFKTEKFNFMLPYPLRSFGDELYYNPAYTDTIFLVTDTAAIAKYAINILYNRIPKFNENTTNAMYESYRGGPYLYFTGDFLELKDMTFVKICTPVTEQFLLYSHKTKKSYLNDGDVNNPLKAFINMVHTPVARYGDNTVVHDVQAYHILRSKKYLYNDEKYFAVLDSLYDGLTEDSNPVLFFYKMRTDFEE